MLVLLVFPLRPDPFLEKVVICLQAEFGRWGDIVLNMSADRRLRETDIAHIDAPKLLYRTERDNFLQKIIPVDVLTRRLLGSGCEVDPQRSYLATGRFGKP